MNRAFADWIGRHAPQMLSSYDSARRGPHAVQRDDGLDPTAIWMEDVRAIGMPTGIADLTDNCLRVRVETMGLIRRRTD
eukprot:COSAG01_NODE_230_length_21075_cov_13.811603_21_plen_79_part_00